MAAPNSLEDKVYRPSLAEGKPAFRRATPWATLPITLGIAGAGAGLGMLLARQPGPPATVVRSVRVVLPAWGEVPAPVGRAPVQPIASGRVPRAAPEDAPPPAVQPRGELLPHHAPSPVAVAGPGPDDRSGVDRSGVDRSGVDRSGPNGADPGPGHPGTPGPGSVAAVEGAAGDRAESGGGRPGRIRELDLTQIREKYRPAAPSYPPLARTARVQGDVVVQILVGITGVPTSARALTGPLPLRSAAESYAMAWRFEPFLWNGVPQASRFNLTVSFRLT